VRKLLRIGISPCPNDTFAFHALLERHIEPSGLDLEIVLDDVESLNVRFASGELDAAKCSFAAALLLAERAVVLPSGSALGFGVGPVLLARDAGAALEGRSRILSPGAGTTAHLLFRVFHPGSRRIEQAVFSEILPRLARGEADFGVCIHEARFTYARHGLALVEDLGSTWERATGSPLPLGGILAKKSLGEAALGRLARAIRASLEHALEHREEALPTMRRHAQELDDEVIQKHVELYVNERTLDLGPEGRAALAKLRAVAVEAGALAPGTPPLDVL
jgi:1,4-dihydroxy-6-naphthoate synthase